MSGSRPRRINANVHPGDRHKVLDTPRRSSAQVKADNAEKEAKIEEVKSKHQAGIARVADIEKRIIEEDVVMASLRPDVQVGEREHVLSDDDSSHSGVDTPMVDKSEHIDSSPERDLPPTSTFDSESDGHVGVGFDEDDDDDADREDDPDYVADSSAGSNSDAEQLEAVGRELAREGEAEERGAGAEYRTVARSVEGNLKGDEAEIVDEFEEFRQWKANQAARKAEEAAATARDEAKKAKKEKKKVSYCYDCFATYLTYMSVIDITSQKEKTSLRMAIQHASNTSVMHTPAAATKPAKTSNAAGTPSLQEKR